MKQTISMIYRLGFILFYVWALFENACFSIQGFLGSFSNFAVSAGFISFICILIVFICSVCGKIPEGLLRVKAVCTALAMFVLLTNFSVWFSPGAPGWILNVLLPFLMFLDWLLFDKKGFFKPFDPLLWLLGIVLFYGLWSLLSGHFFDLNVLWNLLGGKNNALKLLLQTIAAGALMYLSDRLFAGKGFKNLWDVFALIYRILFICLEAWALSAVSGHSLIRFFLSLKNFGLLFNFLSLLCIAVVLMLCLIRFRSLHSPTPFPRVKGAFTASAVVTLIGYHFILKGGFPQGDMVSLILHYVGPFMMIFDWILFDSKGKFKAADPLFWSVPPIVYGLILFLCHSLFALYPPLLTYQAESLIIFGILGVLACGYAVFLLDICFKRK